MTFDCARAKRPVICDKSAILPRPEFVRSWIWPKIVLWVDKLRSDNSRIRWLFSKLVYTLVTSNATSSAVPNKRHCSALVA